MWPLQTKFVIDSLLPLTSAPFLQPPPPQSHLSSFMVYVSPSLPLHLPQNLFSLSGPF